MNRPGRGTRAASGQKATGGGNKTNVGQVLQAFAATSGDSAGGYEQIPSTIQSAPATVDYAGEAPPGSSMQTTTIPNSSYNPLAPFRDTRSAWQKFGGMPSYAGQLNAALASQASLMPGNLAERKVEGQIDSENRQRDLQIAANQKQADEETEAAKQGQALYMAGNLDPNLQSTINTAIPSPLVNPRQQDFANLSRLYQTTQGTIGSQLGSIAGIPANQASAALSTNKQQEAEGESPYSSTIGGLKGFNEALTGANTANKNRIEANTLANPEYQRASTEGSIAALAKPTQTTIGTGDTIIDRFRKLIMTGMTQQHKITEEGGVEYPPGSGKMVGGKPMQVTSTIPGTTKPLTEPVPITPEAKAALEGQESPQTTIPRISTILSDDEIVRRLLGQGPQMLDQRAKSNSQSINARSSNSLSAEQKARLQAQKDEEALRAGKTLRY